jgi:hypothetical protein
VVLQLRSDFYDYPAQVCDRCFYIMSHFMIRLTVAVGFNKWNFVRKHELRLKSILYFDVLMS